MMVVSKLGMPPRPPCAPPGGIQGLMRGRQVGETEPSGSEDLTQRSYAQRPSSSPTLGPSRNDVPRTLSKLRSSCDLNPLEHAQEVRLGEIEGALDVLGHLVEELLPNAASHRAGRGTMHAVDPPISSMLSAST